MPMDGRPHTPEERAWAMRLRAVQRRFEASTEKLMEERDEAIAMCWNEGALSYQGISEATGLSKSRVIQIVRRAGGHRTRDNVQRYRRGKTIRGR